MEQLRRQGRDCGQDVIVALNKFGDDKHSGVQNISGSTDNQVMSFNAHFDYNRTFSDVHNVSAMLLANGFQLTNSGEYHKQSNANLGLQLAYNYDHKYFANFSAAAVHSAKLAEGHRQAFSPSLSLGWDLARESFLEGSAFDNLLLSVSGSILHTDLGIDNYYMYAGYYTQDGAWWGWFDGQAMQSVNSKRGDNKDLTFLKRKEFSVNLKASLWEKALTADLSFFTNSVEGKIINPTAAYPSYFFTYYPEATFIPYANYDNDSRTGFDFAINYNKKFGEFDFSAGLTGTYYTTKATKRDDTNYVDEYQHREGKPIDAIWGYECLGFFRDQADIDASPDQTKLAGNIAPGDLKYKDQNGDGVSEPDGPLQRLHPVCAGHRRIRLEGHAQRQLLVDKRLAEILCRRARPLDRRDRLYGHLSAPDHPERCQQQHQQRLLDLLHRPFLAGQGAAHLRPALEPLLGQALGARRVGLRERQQPAHHRQRARAAGNERGQRPADPFLQPRCESIVLTHISIHKQQN